MTELYSTVYALHASDGTTLWQYRLNSGKTGWANLLAFADGLMYIGVSGGQNGGTISALRAADGSLAWSQQVAQRADQAIVSRGTMYVSSSERAAYALRLSDGKRLWLHPLGESTFEPLALLGSTLYVGGNLQTVYALDVTNGAQRWKYSASAG